MSFKLQHIKACCKKEEEEEEGFTLSHTLFCDKGNDAGRYIFQHTEDPKILS
jgi:hypothetical protein